MKYLWKRESSHPLYRSYNYISRKTGPYCPWGTLEDFVEWAVLQGWEPGDEFRVYQDRGTDGTKRSHFKAHIKTRVV